MWPRIRTYITNVRSAWRQHKDSDAGYASEAVLVTALLIIGALVVIGIIVSKVTSKAQDIDLGVGSGSAAGYTTMVAP
jgi:hypothetical protein